MMAALALFTIRATAVLVLALIVDRLLSRSPAVHRHRVWTTAFGAILMLTILPALLPEIPVRTAALESLVRSASGIESLPLPSRSVVSGEPEPLPVPAAEPTPTAAVDEGTELGRELEGSSLPSLPTGLTVLWLLGATVAVTALLVAHLRARGMVSDSSELACPLWQARVRQLRRRLGLRRSVQLRSTVRVRTPMAGGLWRALVLLPVTAERWPAARRDVVLSHELVHHAHHDPLRHAIVRLAVALLWFHPLAWLAARQALLAREQACDERVVELGARPSEYARELLDLAETLPASRSLPAAVLPMIQRSLLEKRLMSILTRRRSRFALPIALGGCLTLLLGSVALAAVSPQAPTPLAPPPPATPESTAPVASVAAPPAPQEGPALSACEWPDERRRFSGTMSIHESRRDDGRVERHGWGDGWRVMQTNVEEIRLCAQAPSDDRYAEESWSDVVDSGRRVMLELRADGRTHRMEVEGGAIDSWSVDEQARSIDSDARALLGAMLEVADGYWETSRIRGQVSSLRGQISSVRGQRSSLRGRISSLRGQVSSMRGQISSARGRESSLRGEISSLHGRVSSLRGAISSERAELSSIRSAMRVVSEQEQERLQERIRESEQRIRELGQKIEEFDLDAKVAAVQERLDRLDTDAIVADMERQIESFDLDAKVAAVGQELAALDVEGKVAAIEGAIEALDADARLEGLEGRLERAIARLEQALGAIR